MKERNTRLSMIARSNLTEDLKRLLHSEVVYHALNQLNYYSRGIARMKRDELIRFYIQTMDSLPPTRFVGHPGPQFHRYTENYIGLLEAKAFLYYQQHKLSGKDALPFYHISLDSGNTLVDVKGKLFMNWLAARNNLDTTTATEYLAQNLQSLFFFRDLKQFRSLYQDFVSYQPRSNYMHQLKQYLSRLERSLLLGSNDSSIVVWKNYDSLSSVRDLLTSFRGKVVYLDIWGTWCGPCKQELKHLPELKKRFAGKEVVFIYLDMDDDIKDKDWREFILVNRMSGVHVRKNKTTILPFWEELLPNDKEKRGLYPTYFIFDKQGQLAVPRAARPSDRERLYQQIESLL
jgi:thiol-disulfide isomerase/thioredoxin